MPVGAELPLSILLTQTISPKPTAALTLKPRWGRIHALLPDGTILKNVEVFRQIYEILGIGWVYAITKLPLVGAVVDMAYGFWADRRLWLTRRPDLATLSAARQHLVNPTSASASCTPTGRCRLDEQLDS